MASSTTSEEPGRARRALKRVGRWGHDHFTPTGRKEMKGRKEAIREHAKNEHLKELGGNAAAGAQGSAGTNTGEAGSAARSVTKSGTSSGDIGEAPAYTNNAFANALKRGHDLVLGPEDEEIDILKAYSQPEFLEVIATGKRTITVGEKKFEVNLKTTIEQHDPKWEEDAKKFRQGLAEKLRRQDFSEGIFLEELDFIYHAIGGERRFPGTSIEVWPPGEDGSPSPKEAFFKFLITVAKRHDLKEKRGAGNFLASVLKYLADNSSLIGDTHAKVVQYVGNKPPGLFDDGLVFDYLKKNASEVLKDYLDEFEKTLFEKTPEGDLKGVLVGGKNEILSPYNVPGLGYSEEEAARRVKDLSDSLGLQLTSAENDDSAKAALELLKSEESSALSQEQAGLIVKLKEEITGQNRRQAAIVALAEQLLSEAVVKLDEAAGEVKTICETVGMEDNALLALGKFERKYMLAVETLPLEVRKLLSELTDEIKAKRDLYGKELTAKPDQMELAIKTREENIGEIIRQLRGESAKATAVKDEVEDVLKLVEACRTSRRTEQHSQAMNAIAELEARYSQRALNKSRAGTVAELRKAIEERKDILDDIAEGKSVKELRKQVAKNDTNIGPLVDSLGLLSDDLRDAVKKECTTPGLEEVAIQNLDDVAETMSLSEEAEHNLSALKQILAYRAALPERERTKKVALVKDVKDCSVRIADIASSLQLVSVRKELGKTMDEVRSLCSRENYDEAGKVLSDFETRMRYPLKFAAEKILDKHMKKEQARLYSLSPFAWLYGFNIYRGTLDEVKEMSGKARPSRFVSYAKAKIWMGKKALGDLAEKVFYDWYFKYLWAKPLSRFAHIGGWLQERATYLDNLYQKRKDGREERLDKRKQLEKERNEGKITWTKFVWKAYVVPAFDWLRYAYRYLVLPWRPRARQKYGDFEKTTVSLVANRKTALFGALWFSTALYAQVWAGFYIGGYIADKQYMGSPISMRWPWKNKGMRVWDWSFPVGDWPGNPETRLLTTDWQKQRFLSPSNFFSWKNWKNYDFASDRIGERGGPGEGVPIRPQDLAKKAMYDDYALNTLYGIGPVPPKDSSEAGKERYEREKKEFGPTYEWLREKNLQQWKVGDAVVPNFRIPAVLTYLEEVRTGREFSFIPKVARKELVGCEARPRPIGSSEEVLAFVLRKEKANDFVKELIKQKDGVTLGFLRSKTVEWYEKGYLRRHRDEMYENTCGITKPEQLDFMIANPVFAGRIVSWSRFGEDPFVFTSIYIQELERQLASKEEELKKNKALLENVEKMPEAPGATDESRGKLLKSKQELSEAIKMLEKETQEKKGVINAMKNEYEQMRKQEAQVKKGEKAKSEADMMVSHAMAEMSSRLKGDISRVNLENGEAATALLKAYGVPSDAEMGKLENEINENVGKLKENQRKIENYEKAINRKKYISGSKEGDVKAVKDLKEAAENLQKESAEKKAKLVTLRSLSVAQHLDAYLAKIPVDRNLNNLLTAIGEKAAADLDTLKEAQYLKKFESDKAALLRTVVYDAFVAHGKAQGWLKEERKAYDDKELERERSRLKKTYSLESLETVELLRTNNEASSLLKKLKEFNTQYQLGTDQKVELLLRVMKKHLDANGAVADFDPWKRGKLVTWCIRSGFIEDKMATQSQAEQQRQSEIGKVQDEINQIDGKIQELKKNLDVKKEEYDKNDELLAIVEKDLKKGNYRYILRGREGDVNARDKYKAVKDGLYNEKKKMEGELKALDKLKEDLVKKKEALEKIGQPKVKEEKAEPKGKAAKKERQPKAKPPPKPGAAKPPAAKPAPKPAQPAAKPAPKPKPKPKDQGL